MIKPTVFCDFCGKQKADVNHWLIAWFLNEGVQAAKIADTSKIVEVPAFHIARWHEGLSDMNAVIHLCGAECVIKKVNEFLGSK